MKTIAAIATPRGTGGVSIIRISGDDAVNVARRVFMPASGKKIKHINSHTAVYGNIVDGDERIDDGILTLFLSPHSYTGENVAEIACHGGIYVTERVLRVCLDAGARIAGAGEFTKRALLNGKISLTQAESVIDIINSQNKQYLSCSLAQREGALYKKIEEIS
ncbi:MAG: tRNA uridine-5-carboxymethylaminomethyl(34) synthesis GTPase MnmE, partial [Oscillospiraceae bacterium]|nr:tRNA uridine-5-carboxymethylaminomethyl(34) synthesis GTPase MnmE [Oscillospiraceae bacterium]